jgi:hypothetical protein
MRGMEVTVMKKKGGPPMDEDSLVEDAIREVAGRIDKYDSDSLSGAYREKMNPMEAQEGAAEGEAPAMSKEECPECAAGECANPEHMDEEALRAMLASMSDEGRG